MSSTTPATKNEREFKIEEIFFSTTDSRGVIESGNEVFTRISGYSEDNLLGAPHSIIRHPDMPRAVFFLLWDYLLKGKSISAYVKNMAKDGSYYWVYALVSPADGGFLSLRLKPSSPIFDIIPGLYAELKKIELEHGDRGPDRKDGMMAAAQELSSRLYSLGYASYDEFMNAAFIEEMHSRKNILLQRVQESGHRQTSTNDHHPLIATTRRLRLFLNEGLKPLEQFLAVDKTLRANSTTIEHLARSMQQLALNASIRTTHLGQEGATLSVVAQNLGAQSSLLSQVMQSLNAHITQVLALIRRVTNDALSADLTIEMCNCFFDEFISKATVTSSNAQVFKNVTLLSASFQNNVEQSLTALRASSQLLNELTAGFHELEKLIKTLSFVHVTGKVEAARLKSENSFADLFAQIVDEVERAQVALKQITTALDVTRAPIEEFEQTLAYLPEFRKITELLRSETTASSALVTVKQQTPESTDDDCVMIADQAEIEANENGETFELA